MAQSTRAASPRSHHTTSPVLSEHTSSLESGGWDLALQLARWPADREVWTGSCPCQPFSAAGKRRGLADERHLWPEFFRLIAWCRPPVIFGEQVASADGRLWLSGVRAEMEALGYAVWAVDTCAAGVGAPHIRQRLYWVAYSDVSAGLGSESRSIVGALSGKRSENSGLGDANSNRSQPGKQTAEAHGYGRSIVANGGAGGLDLSEVQRREGRKELHAEHDREISGSGRNPNGMEHPESDGREQWRPESSWWGASFRRGADGKNRRIKPELEPLADGVPGRVGKLRAYGNAIVPQVAAEFVKTVMEVIL